MDFVALVVGRDRVHPLGAEAAQVLERHRAARALDLVDHGVGDRALVERVAAVALQQPERPGEARVAEDAVERGGLAVAQVDRGRVRVLGELLGLALPVGVDALADAEALLGELGRGLQHVLEAQVAEALLQLPPAVDGARDGGAVDALLGHLGRLVVAELLEVLGRPGVGRRAARVDPVQLAVVGRVVDGEHVAAGAGAARLDQRQHRRGGDRRVGGRPAVAEDLLAGLRGQRLARGDDAVARDHLRTTLLRPVPRPVAAERVDVLARRRRLRRRLAERRRGRPALGDRERRAQDQHQQRGAGRHHPRPARPDAPHQLARKPLHIPPPVERTLPCPALDPSAGAEAPGDDGRPPAGDAPATTPCLPPRHAA